MNVLQRNPGTMGYRTNVTNRLQTLQKIKKKKLFSKTRNVLRSLENIVLHLNPGTKHVLHPQSGLVGKWV